MENSIRKVNERIDGVTTPCLPLLPQSVAGVAQAVISLDSREGCGGEIVQGNCWEFCREPIEEIPAPEDLEQNFDFAEHAKKDWESVLVPGELEMQGFELLSNTEYYYRTKVHIPEDFAGCKCMLRFDGVYGNARVWVGSQYVRSHVGGFTTWYCDITPYVVPGRDVRLVVGIADLQGDNPGLYNGGEQKPLRDPSGASDYAHHNIGGILRDVTLVALPGAYLDRLHTNVEFDEGFQDARLQIGLQANSGKSHIRAGLTLLDPDGKICLEEEAELKTVGEESDDRKEALTVLQVKKPKKWDAEHPYLYTLQIKLRAGEQVQAVYQENIGFREIGFAGKKGGDRNKIYVNGREVKLRGTCRHDVSLQFGRSTTPEEDWAEVRAYKEANINHVRTSHYPVSRYFLEACDTLGMYVEEENAASFQGDNGYTIYCKPEDFVGEFTEMIERDRNHPSILIWSLANESGFECTEGFRRECEYVRRVDTSRPIIFSYPFTVHSLPLPYDILSMHYVDINAPMGLPDIPVLHDEYMHISCYNMEEIRRDPNVRNFWGRSIKEAWDKIFETDGALGGDLWGGIDDIFYLPENIREKWQSHSKGCAAGYGAWGSVLDVYRRHKPEAYLTKKAYSPVKLCEKDVLFGEEVILIPVKNRFDHTNLNELVMEYQCEVEDGVFMTLGTETGSIAEAGCETGSGKTAGAGAGSKAWAEEAGVSAETEVCAKEARAGAESKAWTRRRISEDIPPHTKGVFKLIWDGAKKVRNLYLRFYKDGCLVDEFVVENGNESGRCQDSHSLRNCDQASGMCLERDGSIREGQEKAHSGNGKIGLNSGAANGEKAAELCVKDGIEWKSGVKMEETEKEIRILAGESEFVFDKEQAQMTKGAFRGRTMLQGGPQLLLTGVPMEQWKKKAPGAMASLEGDCAVVTLPGGYENGFEVWFTVTIREDGRFHTRYLIQGGWTDKSIRELGVRYDLVPGADKISWQRRGLYSCYPEDHIGRNCGTAFKQNRKLEEAGLKKRACRSIPAWDWKDDMWDDFYYSREEADNGLMTRDFRAMRENIEYFRVHFEGFGEFVQAEDGNKQTAARVSGSSLLVINRWNYLDLGWGNDPGRGIYVGRGTYGGISMRFGA